MAALTHTGRYRHWLTGLAVALLGVSLSAWLAWQQFQSLGGVERTRFIQEARAFSDALSQRHFSHADRDNRSTLA